MQVFKTDKNLFWINELKSWLWTFVFAALLFFGFKELSSFTNDNIIIGVIVMLLSKIADTLTQYHVFEIQIDGQNQQLTLVLKSIISGEKIKQYALGQVTSELISHSSLTRYLSSPFTLKIFLKPKDAFIISNRYGFTSETLTSVDRTLKLMKIQSWRKWNA